jgi:prepilin-type N-terminal cleavage/methylation domain-containing protein
MRAPFAGRNDGFTLLEVLITLAILGIGAAMTMSLISGSLGKIRKVQVRARAIQHAQTVMELALLDSTVKGPTTLRGDFEDGTRWIVLITDFDMTRDRPLQPNQPEMPVKALAYTVEIMGPDSPSPDFRVSTLKLVSTLQVPGGGLRPPAPRALP